MQSSRKIRELALGNLTDHTSEAPSSCPGSSESLKKARDSHRFIIEHNEKGKSPMTPEMCELRLGFKEDGLQGIARTEIDDNRAKKILLTLDTSLLKEVLDGKKLSRNEISENLRERLVTINEWMNKPGDDTLEKARLAVKEIVNTVPLNVIEKQLCTQMKILTGHTSEDHSDRQISPERIKKARHDYRLIIEHNEKGKNPMTPEICELRLGFKEDGLQGIARTEIDDNRAKKILLTLDTSLLKEISTKEISEKLRTRLVTINEWVHNPSDNTLEKACLAVKEIVSMLPLTSPEKQLCTQMRILKNEER